MLSNASCDQEILVMTERAVMISVQCSKRELLKVPELKMSGVQRSELSRNFQAGKE